MSSLHHRPIHNIENTIHLFVEGKFDEVVLNLLLAGCAVDVQPLGSCSVLKPVAHSPFISKDDFFLIDHDQYPYSSPFPTKLIWNQRLITWPKRELENYFLDADFLIQLPNDILNASKEKIEEHVLAICQKRLFFDVVEFVLKSLRMEMRKVWDQLGPVKDRCHKRDDALQALLNMEDWKTILKTTNQITEQDEIERRFNDYHKLMTGDSGETLTVGKGHWLSMISGQDVLNELVNNTGIFLNNVTVNDIAKQLLRVPNVILPGDFIDLRNTIKQISKQIFK